MVDASVPLSDLILFEPDLRCVFIKSRNYICEQVTEIWDKYRWKLGPFLSPIVSFTSHPKLLTVA